MSEVSAAFLSKLERRRDEVRAASEALLMQAQSEGRQELSDDDEITYRSYSDTIKALSERIADTRAEVARCGSHQFQSSGLDAMAHGRQWAEAVAEKVTRAMGRDGEHRATISGSIDIPSLVEPLVIPIARPVRLIDLFSNRAPIPGNSFEYYVQSVRTNTATAVADNALKPTSTLTVAPVTDRARVIAHLSEATPLRIFYDHDEFVAWLTSEMVEGVYDGLEQQIVNGDGSGENMTGLLHVAGTTQVAFATDAITTLRSALTALQIKGEVPTGWALHPTDAQAIDLLRWGTSGGLLTEGYQTGVAPGNDASSNNIFGPGITRVVSPSVPVGQAILGDFSKLKIYVREDAQFLIDASGVLFTKNQFIARGEGRYGIGVLRPSSFAICDLTP